MRRSSPRPPRVARWLLSMRRLGDRRADVEADLLELFESRAAATGRPGAARRYWADVLSILMRGPRSAAGPLQRAVPIWPGGIASDVVYAIRLFRRQAGLVWVTVVGLALAIGLSTAVFSVLNAGWLRPIGVERPESTVTVWRRHRAGASTNWPYAEYLELRARARTMALEAWMRHEVSIDPQIGAGSSDPVVVHLVSGGFFETFGGRAARGRVVMPADDAVGAPVVGVLAYLAWVRRFDGDPLIVGRTVELSGVPVRIVGVAERRFTGPVATTADGPALWIALSPALRAWPKVSAGTGSQPSVRVSGSIASGVTSAGAQTELVAIAGTMGRVSAPAGGAPVTSAELVPADNRSGPYRRRISTVTFGAIALVLLLACANLANLLLAAATTREREIGVRLALGASRARVVRQLLTESLLLGACAGGVGLLLAHWLVPGIAALAQAPAEADLAPDHRVYVFVLAISLTTGLLTGLGPARIGTRGALLVPIRGGGGQAGAAPRSARLRAVFVAAQAAASIVLLVLAALFGRALFHASRVDLGIDLDRLAGISLQFDRNLVGARRAASVEAGAERLLALPGVENVALALVAPFSGPPITTKVQGPAGLYVIHQNVTSAEYFSTLGHRVVRGRAYSADEVRAGERVAVITEDLARAFWGPSDPVGDGLERVLPALRDVRVVGVIETAVTSSLRELPAPVIYQPLTGRSGIDPVLIVRTSADVASILPVIAEAVRAIDPPVARVFVWPLRQGLDRELRQGQTLATLAAMAGGLALGLALLGIFGVTTFAVGQRTREIGVRIAVGATGPDVVRQLLRDALRPVLTGLSIGLVIALLSSHVVAGALFGIGPRDPLAIAAAVALLLATAMAAVILPARRAASIDPAVVLRQET